MWRCFLVVVAGAVARLAAQDCEDPGVRVTQEKRGDAVHIYAEPVNCLEATILFTAELTNMRSSRTLPVKAELRGPQRVELCVLQPAAEGKWSFRSRYQWVPGTPGGRPDGALYRLPFAPGAGYRLIQGYRGDFSHQAGSADEHALDFQMPEGTPVLAARAGVVAAVRQDSTRGGRTRRFRNCANYVVVRHGDGTYAEYYHLRPNGARVKPGDPVAAGQLLGLSGNTGYSMLPHLHFAVYRPIDGQRRESLPVKFQSAGGKPLPLAEGRNY